MRTIQTVLNSERCVHFRNKEFAKQILRRVQHLLPYEVSEFADIQANNGLIVMLKTGARVTNQEVYTHNYRVWNQTKFERFLENNVLGSHDNPKLQKGGSL